jgi:ubiquinone biosynthesis protein
MFERPIKLISFGEMLIRLFQTAQRFQMKILPQMLLLQKTLVNIEGLGRQLCPDMDLWGTARPTLERWMRERLGIRRVAHVTKANLPVWGERLPQLPGLAFQVLDQVRHGSIQVQNHPQDLMKLRQEIRLANRRTVLTIVGMGFLLSASILLVAGTTSSLLQWQPTIAISFALMGAGVLAFAFLGREA